jgi:hypothetical protein
VWPSGDLPDVDPGLVAQSESLERPPICLERELVLLGSVVPGSSVVDEFDLSFAKTSSESLGRPRRLTFRRPEDEEKET